MNSAPYMDALSRTPRASPLTDLLCFRLTSCVSCERRGPATLPLDESRARRSTASRARLPSQVGRHFCASRADLLDGASGDEPKKRSNDIVRSASPDKDHFDVRS